MYKCGRGLRARYIRHISEFLIDHLEISNSRYNVAVTPLKEKRKRHGGIVNHDKRGIVVRLLMQQKPEDLGAAICHEFVHVKQIARGLLSFDGKEFTWRGKRYPKNHPYLERPWEIQAMREEVLLLRTYEAKCTRGLRRDTIQI